MYCIKPKKNNKPRICKLTSTDICYKAAQEETANFLSYYDSKVSSFEPFHREKQFFPVLPHNMISLPLQCLKEWQVLEVRDTEETQFSRLFTLNRHVVKTPVSLVMIILRAASMASQIMSCLV